MKGLEPLEPRDDERPYVFTRAGSGALESVDLGRVVLSPGKLRLETDSVARADALRQRLEDRLGELVRHRGRSLTDPMAAMKAQREAPRARAEVAIPNDEADRITREVKARHYEDWVDRPLPALGGETPRQACRTRAGRERVELLLRDVENHEARLEPGQRYDFSILRARLGLGS